MFSKKSHADSKKSAQKVLDPKKDSVTRLKHLRTVIEFYDSHDCKNFFEANYSPIYYTFYDVFISVEVDLRQRASKAHRDDLDNVLFIFEKILLCLPELIHKKWQYHSIGRLMKKLLHPGNTLRLRKEGTRLFLIWYQIINTNGDEASHTMFANLVPALSSKELIETAIVTTSSDFGVSPVEIIPILPAQGGEKEPEDLNRFLLETLLTFMVSEVTKVEWSSSRQQIESFEFLFNRFKKHYLPNIFPTFSYSRSLYQPTLELPTVRLPGDDSSEEHVNACKETVVKWMSTFVTTYKKPQPIEVTSPNGGSGALSDSARDTPDSSRSEAQADHPSGSNASTMSSTEKDSVSAGSSVCSDDHSLSEYEIVRQVLFSSRENVNLVHEVFRKAFLFPFKHHSAIKRVINVYKDWLQSSTRPLFMLEPDNEVEVKPAMSAVSQLKREEVGTVEKPLNGSESKLAVDDDSFPRLRNNSYVGAIGESPRHGAEDTACNVKAGLQKTLQVFVSSAANVFLLDTGDSVDDHQVDLCKRVLSLYRYLVMNLPQEQQTWEQLLLVLLRITKSVLKETPPTKRDECLGGRLATGLFQTLIVTWIKANLSVHVSSSLWDHLLSVLSSLTEWEELIKEWAKAMDTLTKILAKQVYNLDLQDLPLDRFTTQKEKRRRAQANQHLKAAQLKNHKKNTLSHGWSRFDSNVPAYSRLVPKSSVSSGNHNNEVDAETRSEGDADMTLTRQRSFSGHLSLTDLPTPPENLIRSSSDSDLASSSERLLKAGTTSFQDAIHVPTTELTEDKAVINTLGRESAEDQEVASVTTVSTVTDAISLDSVDSSHFPEMVFGQDRSDSDTLPRGGTLTSENCDIMDGENRTILLPIVKIQSSTSVGKTIMSDSSGIDCDISSLVPSSSADASLDSIRLSPHSLPHSTPLVSNSYAEDPSHDWTGPSPISMENSTIASGEDGDNTAATPCVIKSDSMADGNNYTSNSKEVSGDGSDEENDDEDDDNQAEDGTPAITLAELESLLDVLDETKSANNSLLEGWEEEYCLHISVDDSAFGSAPNSSNHLTINHQASQTPSPVSLASKQSSRTGSPVNSLADDVKVTPDRESLQIDLVMDADRTLTETPVRNSIYISNNTTSGADENKSVLAGGAIQGWSPEVAVILWRRMLGSLGDINNVGKPTVHASVYEYLCDLVEVLLKMHDNLAISPDNSSSPAMPELIPPILWMATWCFQALELPSDYKSGQLLAYRLLCIMALHRDGAMLTDDHIGQFFRHLHYGLVSTDQDFINTLVRHASPRINAVPLLGSSVLILDFIHAANTIIANTDMKETPRKEAVSLLGAYLCFPNHFGTMPVLQPNAVDLSLMSCADTKDHIITILLKAGKKEPSSPARCIALCSLGIYVYEELLHNTLHCKMKEAINVLLASLRFNKKSVAQIASDMLQLLCDLASQLMTHHPDLPKKIIDIIVTAIMSLLPCGETGYSEDNRKLVVSMFFCLVSWCMSVPANVLFEENWATCLLQRVFRVLSLAVLGTSGSGVHAKTSAALSAELYNKALDLDSDDMSSPPASPKKTRDVTGDGDIDEATESRQLGFEVPQRDNDSIKLAAQAALCHLVNHLGQFPLGTCAAQFLTEIQEHHDLDHLFLDELLPDIFNSPSVQFFVLNNQLLISFVEIPHLHEEENCPSAGLTTAKSVCRVIIRDVGGKHSWDSAILYGPPRCRAGSYPQVWLDKLRREPQQITELILEDSMDRKRKSSSSSLDTLSVRSQKIRQATELPVFENTEYGDDNLKDLLVYIGTTSPECMLTAGEPLNIPASPPSEMTLQVEVATVGLVVQQQETEQEHFGEHTNDTEMSAKRHLPPVNFEPSSPFQMCRLLLDQLGLMSWVKRPHFEVMRKSDKLLRELKNLDNQRCRETHKIAVIYIAEGQEDKQSILGNTCGSSAFENFVSGLGWEVDLETHKGFMGGLQRNGTNGTSATYYATSLMEVMFHVSTRMPSDAGEDGRKRKLRHLGNDEVHIVWSEHSRDYRRGIIPTEFGDVLIVIYPLDNGLFRIQIKRKPQVPLFGPLFDGAILDETVLPGLVRATAINASRHHRASLPYYRAFFEERAKYIDMIVEQHKEPTMFEDFAASVFAPVLPACKEGNDLPLNASFSSLQNGLVADLARKAKEEKTQAEKQEQQSQHSTKRDSADNVSPQNEKGIRRLSLKSKKPSAPKVPSTPPDSPVSKTKK